MEGRSLRNHFWVASAPSFQTNLFIVPDGRMFRGIMLDSQPGDSGLEQGQSTYSVHIKLFDCDGALVNEITTGFPSDRTGILELDPFLEVCKYEGGMKHGRVLVVSEETCRHVCRLQGRDNAALMGELLPLTAQQRSFVPVTLSEVSSSILVLSNIGTAPAQVRVKLMVGKRSPESYVEIPAGGTRLIGLESEFPEFSDLNLARGVKGYLRLSGRNEDFVGVQLVEVIEGAKDSNIFTTLS